MCRKERSPTERVDAAHRVLSDRRRRCALDALDGADGPMGLTALVERVRGLERDGADRGAVAVTLHHVHLPKMAEEGVVEYADRGDRDRQVELTEFGETVSAVADASDVYINGRSGEVPS